MRCLGSEALYVKSSDLKLAGAVCPERTDTNIAQQNAKQAVNRNRETLMVEIILHSMGADAIYL